MAGNSIKNKDKYEALKRKGMSKGKAARISNAGTSASRRVGARAAASEADRRERSPRAADERASQIGPTRSPWHDDRAAAPFAVARGNAGGDVAGGGDRAICGFGVVQRLTTWVCWTWTVRGLS
jgi:hypothetical protein